MAQGSLYHGSYANSATITTSDSTVLSPTTVGVYVGGTGDLKVTMLDGSTPTFKAVPVGALLPIQVTKIWATGTTATQIVALW